MIRNAPLSGLALIVSALLCLAGCRERAVRIEWTAMGTIAALQVRGGAGNAAVETAKRQMESVERLLNAHDPDSEIRRLSPLSDDEVLRRCAPTVRECYAAAFRLAEESHGAFNPRWRSPDTLDLGAIAKGFAVDCAAEALSGARVPMLIDLGGNLKAVRCAGGGEGRSWRTGVRGARGGIAATVELREGEALATSAEYFRGRHIFDARTGRPASRNVVSVTVLCRSAMLADGLSTTLFILGPDEGLAFLRRQGYDASILFLLSDGGHVVNDERFSIRF